MRALGMVALAQHQHLVIVLGEARGLLLHAPHERAGGVDQLNPQGARLLVDFGPGAMRADQRRGAGRDLAQVLDDLHAATL